jgi:hypothetical protein
MPIVNQHSGKLMLSVGNVSEKFLIYVNSAAQQKKLHKQHQLIAAIVATIRRTLFKLLERVGDVRSSICS